MLIKPTKLSLQIDLTLKFLNAVTQVQLFREFNPFFHKRGRVAGLDSYKEMVRGQFPFPLHLTVQFELRIQSDNKLNTQTTNSL